MKIHSSTKNIVRLAVIGSFVLAAPVLAADHSDHGHADHDHVPAKLVEEVRDATLPFLDVNAAIAAGYGQFLGCLSSPDFGAMGVHYVNGGLVADGELDPSQPEALLYQVSNGRIRLLGIEFIVDAATWLAHHDAPPVLEGQVFQFVDSPNRFNLVPFFELHVWAWRDNPNGAFVDWNTRVSCEGQ